MCSLPRHAIPSLELVARKADCSVSLSRRGVAWACFDGANGFGRGRARSRYPSPDRELALRSMEGKKGDSGGEQAWPRVALPNPRLWFDLARARLRRKAEQIILRRSITRDLQRKLEPY